MRMSVKNGYNCYGCRVCEQVCPVKAISFHCNERGFYYPEIDKTKCTGCNLCEKSCGLNNKREKNRPLNFYALKIRDKSIKKKSSSGGAFYLLAKLIIEEGGVVYGCYVNDSIDVVYGRAETLDECIPFMGSKYVQSDMQDVVTFVKADLKAGRKVLFTGTPCGCLGIKTAITKFNHTGQLILCDFYCHGAPSPMIFSDFKLFMERKYGGKIVNFIFRDKEKVINPPSSRGMRMNIKRKDEIIDVYDSRANDMYFEMFKYNYILRECCYECPCIGIERDTDITMGDYWGCENFHPEFFDRDGISVISINTRLGKVLFDNVCENAEYIQIKEDEIRQPMILHAPQKANDYDKIWNVYYSEGFENAANVVINAHKLNFYTRFKISMMRRLPVSWSNALRKMKHRAK